MKIQLIRNATLKIKFAGKTILVDPMLSTKGSFDSFAGKEKNPIVDLPLTISEIVDDVDLVLVSHTHEDHFDEKAKEYLPKDLPVFCQPIDEGKIRLYSFSNLK